jgi:UDP-N-acetylglucosamine 1-carboxyvinyltransferase
VEPEIIDLVHFLNTMGAQIEPGTDHIVIHGVDTLSGTDYTPISDRIEAGTLMLAAAVTGGEVSLLRASAAHLMPVCDKLLEAGMEIFPFEGGLKIRGRSARPIEIISSPYPGFPTDMQAPFMAACCLAKGQSIVNETIFENRFLHVDELKKMGADISVKGSTAVINGSGCLYGAEVVATDLRAGAALCIAGLFAKGDTIIGDIYHLERGYENFEDKLLNLGANIVRLS